VLLAPAIPLYYIVRFGRFLWRRRSPHLAVFLRHLPFVYAMQLVAALAQAAGLLFGPGDAERVFTAFEVSEARPETEAALR
jgi:hypothetical protein